MSENVEGFAIGYLKWCPLFSRFPRFGLSVSLRIGRSLTLLCLIGDADWAALSEQERQRRLVKLKLEERRLRKEGQMDELQRLLGEGFEMDANLRKLMGENKARYVSEFNVDTVLFQC